MRPLQAKNGSLDIETHGTEAVEVATAAIDEIVAKNGGLPRTAPAFERLVQQVRAELPGVLAAVVTTVVDVLAVAHDVEKTLKASVATEVLPALVDMKTQLASLVHKGFVTETGVRRLAGLVRYLSALVGAGDAEDVASETWAQVCRDLPKFRGDGDGFRGWVSTIGRHRALDHLRALGRRPQCGATEAALAERAAPDEVDTEALVAISTQAAMELIRLLPQDQAEAVLLRAVMGLDAKAAGRVLGKRPGAVRTAAHRGLRTLATLLNGPATTSVDDDSDVFAASIAEEVL